MFGSVVHSITANTTKQKAINERRKNYGKNSYGNENHHHN